MRYGENIKIINEMLISEQNDLVDVNDTVYYVGDFVIGDIDDVINISNKLNGIIYLILGNHDTLPMGRITNKFHVITKNIYRLLYNNYTFNLFHYPLYEWPDYHIDNSIHVHGHTHGKCDKYNNRSIDVGYDNNNFRLLSIYDIIKLLK